MYNGNVSHGIRAGAFSKGTNRGRQNSRLAKIYWTNLIFAHERYALIFHLHRIGRVAHTDSVDR